MDALQVLGREIVACRRCPRLVAWRQRAAGERRSAFAGCEYWARPVPGFGDPAARIVLVGLAPGAHGANRTGRVFTGDRSGDFLFAALHRTGLASQASSRRRDDGMRLTGAYVTAAVRCAPPDNRPTPRERDTCAPYLDREIALLSEARVYVALGAFAHAVLARSFDLSPRPQFGHGKMTPLPGRRTLLDTYHPSPHNTSTGRLTEEMLDAILARAMRMADLAP